MKQRTHHKPFGQTPLAEHEIANPHDVFFKKLIGRRATAIQFLKLYLPAEVIAPFDWRALERVEDTFISEELREHFSDLIFRVRLKDGSPVYVYILLEHKSAPERWVALQVLGYIVALWQQMKDGGAQELPLVIPVVFYHGQRRWNVGLHLADLIRGAERAEWRRFVPDFEYYLCDLSRYSDEEIKGASGLQAGLLLLKHIFGDEMEGQLAEIVKTLPPGEVKSLLLPMVLYVSSAAKITPNKIEKALKQAFSESPGGTMQTAAQIWLEQGWEKGRQEGRREGRREGRQEEASAFVLRLLTRVLGPLSPRIESRIRRLSLEQLEQLGEALLGFEKPSHLTAWLRANQPAPAKKAKRQTAAARS